MPGSTGVFLRLALACSPHAWMGFLQALYFSPNSLKDMRIRQTGYPDLPINANVSVYDWLNLYVLGILEETRALWETHTGTRTCKLTGLSPESVYEVTALTTASLCRHRISYQYLKQNIHPDTWASQPHVLSDRFPLCCSNFHSSEKVKGDGVHRGFQFIPRVFRGIEVRGQSSAWVAWVL